MSIFGRVNFFWCRLRSAIAKFSRARKKRLCCESRSRGCRGGRVGRAKSRSINHHKLALVRPKTRMLHQSRSNEIFAHILPLLPITLFISEDVIEESRLP